MTLSLEWLAKADNWNDRFRALSEEPGDSGKQTHLMQLVRQDLDFFQVNKIARWLAKPGNSEAVKGMFGTTARVAIIGTGTLGHLAAPIQLACMRHNIWVDVFVGGYNQFQNDLLAADSALAAFKPNVVLFSIDARFASVWEGGDVKKTLNSLEKVWAIAREKFGATLLQQTFLPLFPEVIGSNEHRLSGAPQAFIAQMNTALRPMSDASNVALVDMDAMVRRYGLRECYDPALWYRAKQEIHPAASLLYGDLVARVIAAGYGKSAKCIVLDLDNTLWGGVIGDDGLEGIHLGQGDPVGEAYLEFQKYLLSQKARGVVLAVCSKNDHDTAIHAMDSHPDMLIRSKDIASFAINWENKAGNLKKIAHALNIGTDALLFVDDNPAERALVRREMPEVMVPELPVDPACYGDRLSMSGYLEAVSVTGDDVMRAAQYQANSEREKLRAEAADMTGYLNSLEMRLVWAPFTKPSLARIVQLANKTNQFNLTTRRYADAEVEAMIGSQDWITVQARLIDKFGDNGIITLAAAKVQADAAVVENWLMSCRVFGRQVEDVVLNLLVSQAGRRGVKWLVGDYLPTPKNAIVADLYAKMGFERVGDVAGGVRWKLDVRGYRNRETAIIIKEAKDGVV